VTAQYDKAAKVGVVHQNKADRKKSRLTKAVNAIAKG
jgi:ribosomal protein S20